MKLSVIAKTWYHRDWTPGSLPRIALVTPSLHCLLPRQAALYLSSRHQIDHLLPEGRSLSLFPSVHPQCSAVPGTLQVLNQYLLNGYLLSNSNNQYNTKGTAETREDFTN